MAVTVDTIEALAKKALQAKYGKNEGAAIAFLLMGGYGVPGIIDGATLAAQANTNVETGIDFTEDTAASLVSDVAQDLIVAALKAAGVAAADAIALPLVIGLKGLLSSTEIGPEVVPGTVDSPISDTPIATPIPVPILIPPSIPIVLPTIASPPPPVEPETPPPPVEPETPPPPVEPETPPPPVEPETPPPVEPETPPPTEGPVILGGEGAGNGGATGAFGGGIGAGGSLGGGTVFAGPDSPGTGGGETSEGGSHIHHIPHFLALSANPLKPKKGMALQPDAPGRQRQAHPRTGDDLRGRDTDRRRGVIVDEEWPDRPVSTWSKRLEARDQAARPRAGALSRPRPAGLRFFSLAGDLALSSHLSRSDPLYYLFCWRRLEAAPDADNDEDGSYFCLCDPGDVGKAEDMLGIAPDLRYKGVVTVIETPEQFKHWFED